MIFFVVARFPPEVFNRNVQLANRFGVNSYPSFLILSAEGTKLTRVDLQNMRGRDLPTAFVNRTRMAINDGSSTYNLPPLFELLYKLRFLFIVGATFIIVKGFEKLFKKS